MGSDTHKVTNRSSRGDLPGPGVPGHPRPVLSQSPCLLWDRRDAAPTPSPATTASLAHPQGWHRPWHVPLAPGFGTGKSLWGSSTDAWLSRIPVPAPLLTELLCPQPPAPSCLSVTQPHVVAPAAGRERGCTAGRAQRGLWASTPRAGLGTGCQEQGQGSARPQPSLPGPQGPTPCWYHPAVLSWAGGPARTREQSRAAQGCPCPG